MRRALVTTACIVALSFASRPTSADDADPFGPTYDDVVSSLSALGDASISLRAEDRGTATSRLADAASAADGAMQSLWTISGASKAAARRLRSSARRFVSRVLDARSASLDAAVDDPHVARRVSLAVRAGEALTNGLARSSLGDVRARATSATASVAGVWTGTYDSTNGPVDAYEWWADITVTKTGVTATWVALTGPLGTSTNLNSKQATMHGWISGNTLYLVNDTNATVILRATVTGTSLSGNYIQSGGVLFNQETTGASFTDGTFTGTHF
jgi:hypothetical protein